MRYYELNSAGNKLGPKNLQCPVCGNAAILMIKDVVRKINITVSKNGSLRFVDKSKIIIVDNDEMLMCPQCEINMIEHGAVVDYHKAEYCPGCIICGEITPNILEICQSCVMLHEDTARGCCTECRYNYSRREHGIDTGELKEYLHVSRAYSEDGYQQEDVFDDVLRSSYKKGKAVRGGPVYEQIT